MCNLTLTKVWCDTSSSRHLTLTEYKSADAFWWSISTAILAEIIMLFCWEKRYRNTGFLRSESDLWHTGVLHTMFISYYCLWYNTEGIRSLKSVYMYTAAQFFKFWGTCILTEENHLSAGEIQLWKSAFFKPAAAAHLLESAWQVKKTTVEESTCAPLRVLLALRSDPWLMGVGGTLPELLSSFCSRYWGGITWNAHRHKLSTVN